MCLAVPGKVLDVEEGLTRMATVDFGGAVKRVCIAYLPEVEVGEYVIVHVGFAIQRLDERSALRTLEMFRSRGTLEEEFGDPWAGAPRADDSTPAASVRPGGDGPAAAGEATT